LDKGIAFQIRATRDKREWSQADLARAIGMGQNNISRLENPDYGKHTLSSLKRIAEALDVALVVRFVPFSQYVHWLSGTPYLDEGLRPEALAVDSFEQEEERGALDIEHKYWERLVSNQGQYTPALTMKSGAGTPLLDASPNGTSTSPVPNALSGESLERLTA
jgi:transcriptional regulator with XRE-family HTH domain